jgi:hypothetical protein
LSSRAWISRRSGSPHLIGRLSRGLRGLRKVGTIALARQPLELACDLFCLFCQRALARAATLAALTGNRLLTLALGLLLLTPGELAEFFTERVDLLVGLLLLRALGGLVLIRQLVHVLLEQLREIFRHRTGATATAAATAALLADLLLVLLLGLLQLRQRTLFGRQRLGCRLRLQLRFGRAHFLDRFRKQLGDPLERGIRLDEPAVHPADKSFDLLSQLRL